MGLVIVASLLVASFGAAGCDRGASTPFSPSAFVPSDAARTSPSGDGYWHLTATLTSIAGPMVCFDRRSAIGSATEALLDVRRDGAAIALVYDLRRDPADRLEVVGTVEGDRFAASAGRSGSTACGGTAVDYELETYVTGELSPDGRSLIASERRTYRLPTGQSLVLWFAWTARH